jgi:hypothetical protein
MQPQEFRIGNLVMTCTPEMDIMIPHIIAKVQGIGIFGDVEFCNTTEHSGFKMNPKHIIGVPIGSKRLDFAGFTRKHSDDGTEWFHMKHFEIRLSQTIRIEDFDDDIYKWEIFFRQTLITDIQYVHELQNLFFDLEKEELKVE